MEWQREDQGDWIHDAERWIGQIKGVLQCKIDVDEGGDVTGVHVVATQARDPRHIVRDVEGLLKARLGIAIFYKKIGVVQVIEPPREEPAAAAAPAGAAAGAPPAPSAPAPAAPDEVEDEAPADGVSEAILLAEELAPRVKCAGVSLLSTESTVRADVELRAAGTTARGGAEGPNRSASDLDLIAEATLLAVQQLLDEAVTLNLIEVRVDPVAGQKVVLAAVELIEGRRAERLYGTCPPQQNLHQAVVYAVLDALNRRLALMAFRAADAEGRH